MPSSAISRSAASSQIFSPRRSSSRRLRLRSARSSAPTRAPCSLSTASTRRSRKRRRSPAGPVKSPSMAGVSQTMRTWSAKRAARKKPARGRRGIFSGRRRPARLRRPVPNCSGPPASPVSSSEMAKPPLAALASEIGCFGAPQAPAGREKRDRFEQIGLAGAVFAGKRRDRARNPQIERAHRSGNPRASPGGSWEREGWNRRRGESWAAFSAAGAARPEACAKLRRSTALPNDYRCVDLRNARIKGEPKF